MSLCEKVPLSALYLRNQLQPMFKLQGGPCPIILSLLLSIKFSMVCILERAENVHVFSINIRICIISVLFLAIHIRIMRLLFVFLSDYYGYYPLANR
jgi:hypothetical protein